MKVFQKLWCQRGILCFIYLDDILVVGQTFHQTQPSIQFVLETLEASGMVANKVKSTLVPCQSVQHLGFQINFQVGTLQVPPEKLKSVRRELENWSPTHSSLVERWLQFWARLEDF